MKSTPESPVVQKYLDLLDAQREQTFTAIKTLSFDQIWQRPAPAAWSIGEILNHNVLLIQSMFPLVKFTWRFFRWTGRLLQSRQYRTTIADPYRKDRFPHWVGFLWKPKYTPDNPVPLETLLNETRQTHREIRRFYEGKDEALLGHVHLFDPLFGFINLILTLRVGIYHDQLHYEDVIKQAEAIQQSEEEK